MEGRAEELKQAFTHIKYPISSHISSSFSTYEMCLIFPRNPDCASTQLTYSLFLLHSTIYTSSCAYFCSCFYDRLEDLEDFMEM
jgi:hypothetical protein